MNFYKLKYLSIILIPSFIQVGAQEFSETDVGFEAELIEIGGGLSCIDSFNQASRAKLKGRPFKAFKTGKNVRGGSLIYFGEGFGAKPCQDREKRVETIKYKYHFDFLLDFVSMLAPF